MTIHDIVLDTETTGLSPSKGDRIVEIGCVRVVNYISTGESYHVYLCPERNMPKEAFAVHGLSDQFLSNKPKFREIVDEFLAFIKGARLVIHNAAFDVGFLNAELARVGMPPILLENTLDTVSLARSKYPGAQNSLNALCRRYGIDYTHRTQHGALLDAQLLVEVYTRLLDAEIKQAALDFNTLINDNHAAQETITHRIPLPPRPHPLTPRITQEELDRHIELIETLGISPIWNSYES